MGLELRMFLWRPKFYQDGSYFPSNHLLAEFQWIQMSTCWVTANLVTHRSTCKPYDVTILIVVVVCSESVLSVVFRFFKCWYLWNQIRYQETVNGVHSCFSCTFIRENKNFHFVSTLSIQCFFPFPLQIYNPGAKNFCPVKKESLSESSQITLSDAGESFYSAGIVSCY